MKGKAIYNPSGKAGEYSYWAVNFYNGCSADCEYCYCKRGVMSSLWSTTPTIKKSLKNHGTAMDIFKKEVVENLEALRENGLFFNFTSDPFLRETIDLNYDAIQFCNGMEIPVKALTKQTWWIGKYDLPENVTIGYTLTGHDELEPGAGSTQDRLDALMLFHDRGYKTWASIEPVIDIKSSLEMIRWTIRHVDHYKIGPMSGKKFYLSDVDEMIHRVHGWVGGCSTIYWKEGFIEKLGIIRQSLPPGAVSRDYRWWT